MMSLSSDDFNIFGSMEAQAHVYLEALATMKSPLKQIELEAEVLDSIWTVLQGKRTSRHQGSSWSETDNMRSKMYSNLDYLLLVRTSNRWEEADEP